MAALETDTVPARAVKARFSFFFVASAVMTLIVFLGFLPSFYLRPQFRPGPLPAHLIVHGLIMTSWQLLFLAQTSLVAVRRTDLHRKLGLVGAGLAVAVVVAGVFASLRLPAEYAAKGIELPFPVSNLAIGNLFGFALFAGFVAAAIWRRRDTGSHRRLIYWACVVTMGPAVTPFRTLGSIIAPYFPTTFPPEIALGWICWAALLLHDWHSARRFHPVTIIGGFLILFIMPALLDWTLTIEALSNWVNSLV
jgi:hypothetical protein